jgi:hypothetical protein
MVSKKPEEIETPQRLGEAWVRNDGKVPKAMKKGR